MNIIIDMDNQKAAKEIKKLISQGMVYVDGEQVKKSESKYEQRRWKYN